MSSDLRLPPCSLVAPENSTKKEVLRTLVVNNECAAVNESKLISWQQYYDIIIMATPKE